jgi:hypothetical protein
VLSIVSGLRIGGVEDQDIDRPEPLGHRGDQVRHRLLVGDVGDVVVGPASHRRRGWCRQPRGRDCPRHPESVYGEGDGVACEPFRIAVPRPREFPVTSAMCRRSGVEAISALPAAGSSRSADHPTPTLTSVLSPMACDTDPLRGRAPRAPGPVRLSRFGSCTSIHRQVEHSFGHDDRRRFTSIRPRRAEVDG